MLGGTDRNSENPQDNWSLSRGVNPVFPEYKAKVIIARLPCSGLWNLKVNHPVEVVY